MCFYREMISVTDDQAGSRSAAPRDEAPQTPGHQPDASQAEDPGYLIEAGEAVGDDGSVAPIIGGLPAVEGSSWDIGAPVDGRGANLAHSQERQPDEPGEDTSGN
jgi:hypothetical protein